MDVYLSGLGSSRRNDGVTQWMYIRVQPSSSLLQVIARRRSFGSPLWTAAEDGDMERSEISSTDTGDEQLITDTSSVPVICHGKFEKCTYVR